MPKQNEPKIELRPELAEADRPAVYHGKDNKGREAQFIPSYEGHIIIPEKPKMKEETRLYQLANGTKQWITEPESLELGFKWNKVAFIERPRRAPVKDADNPNDRGD